MNYTPITVKTALHKLKPGRLPFTYDLNVYRGCSHGCIYCYAMYSHKYMASENYFDEIFIKTNIAEVLDEQLKRRKDKGVINLGGVCDSYQPCEIKQNQMSKILKVLIKHKAPITISTKSDLLLRDIELIKTLSNITSVNIAATITTMDESVRTKIEPGAISSERRFKMLERLKKETNASVGVHIMPIIPYLTDTKENLEAIYRRANEINADYVLPGLLYLRGKTRSVFFDHIVEKFPHLSPKLKAMYAYNYDRSTYRKVLYTYIDELRKTYGFPNENTLKKPKKNNEQLQLF